METESELERIETSITFWIKGRFMMKIIWGIISVFEKVWYVIYLSWLS
jgi:hypothetical protein